MNASIKHLVHLQFIDLKNVGFYFNLFSGNFTSIKLLLVGGKDGKLRRCKKRNFKMDFSFIQFSSFDSFRHKFNDCSNWSYLKHCKKFLFTSATALLQAIFLDSWSSYQYKMNSYVFFKVLPSFFPMNIVLYIPKHHLNSHNWSANIKRILIYLTNRFKVAICLFSNRSQMTSKCGKNKKVAHKAQLSASLMDNDNGYGCK